MSRKNSPHTVDMKAVRAVIKESAEISAVAGIAFVAAAEDGRVADTIITGHRERFGAWMPGEEYAVGQIRLYQDALYRCVQAHTAQDDWAPDIVPALWARVADPAEEWPAWSQPIGAHDAYAPGDKVSHADRRWVSETGGNVWEPGVHGWEEA